MSDNKDDIKKANKIGMFFLKMGEVYSFGREHWFILSLAGTIFVSAFTLFYKANVEPTMSAFVMKTTHVWMDDSLGTYIDGHLSTKGGGTRGNLAKYVSSKGDSLAKADVVPVLGDLIVGEKLMEQRIKELETAVLYSRAIGDLLIGETFKDTINRRIHLKLAPSGDMYYVDSLNIPWAASWKNRLSRWVYYPPYNNNERTTCKPPKRQ